MRSRIEHQIGLTPEQYFEKVYTNTEFQALIADAVAMRKREILTEEDRGNVYYREVLQIPSRDLPGVVKKVVGADQLSYINKGTYYKDRCRLEFVVIPSVKPDRITISGCVWLEPSGSGSRRICEMDVGVNIFGVGKVVEKLVLNDVVKGQERVVQLINRHF